MNPYMGTYSDEATSFSGKLRCTIDPSMPLNISNITQPFLMTCESPSNNSGWWILLYLVCGIAAFIALWASYDRASDWFKTRKRERERRRREEERQQKEEERKREEAARNDHV